jgi:hypothetical protein
MLFRKKQAQALLIIKEKTALTGGILNYLLTVTNY